jgi:hypothetical protein
VKKITAQQEQMKLVPQESSKPQLEEMDTAGFSNKHLHQEMLGGWKL